MIAVIIRDLKWRCLLLLGAAAALYALEPGFHQHEEFTLDAAALGPLGVSATLSYLGGISMIILLAGFVAGERREGYTRIHLSNPMSPLQYFGLRWVIAYVLSVAFAAVFLVVGQLIAWGEFLGGWAGLVMPVLSAIVYGGLLAFLSTVLPRGDAGIVLFLLIVPTFFPEIVSLALGTLTTPARAAINLALPPHNALADVWNGLLDGAFAWPAAAYAAGYGFVFLLAAGITLRLREWP